MFKLQDIINSFLVINIILTILSVMKPESTNKCYQFPDVNITHQEIKKGKYGYLKCGNKIGIFRIQINLQPYNVLICSNKELCQSNGLPKFVTIKYYWLNQHAGYPELNKKYLQAYNREIDLLSQFNSERIIKFYGKFFNLEKNYLFLVMEFCKQGTLRTYVLKNKEGNGGLNPKHAMTIFLQICKGVFELHQKSVMHRDLHIDNVMRKGEQWKIIDLGFAKAVANMNQDKHTILGREDSKAPEFYSNDIQKTYYGIKVDIWSLGALLYYMLTSNTFVSNQIYIDQQMRKQTIKSNLERQFVLKSSNSTLSRLKIDDKLRDFLSKMLQFNPIQRYDIYKVLDDEIFTDYGLIVEQKYKHQSSNKKQQQDNCKQKIVQKTKPIKKQQKSKKTQISSGKNTKYSKQRKSGLQESKTDNEKDKIDEQGQQD